MILFLDTSALVKLYIAEPDSEVLLEVARRSRVAVSTLAFAEAHATFARRYRENSLSLPELQLVRQRFTSDWAELIEIPLGATVSQFIPGLCDRHPLRGGDAVQLASALVLAQGGLAVAFACFDLRLRSAAEAEGIRLLERLSP